MRQGLGPKKHDEISEIDRSYDLIAVIVRIWDSQIENSKIEIMETDCNNDPRPPPSSGCQEY